MKDERPPQGPADEEELRSAAALARALEGAADEPDVPQAALEAAALLRLSAGVAQLDDTRREAIKQELLAGLPARSERRRRAVLPGWARWFSERGLPNPRWSFLALPLAGTAVVCLLLLAKGPEPEASFADRSAAEKRLDVETAARGGMTALRPAAPQVAAPEPAPGAAPQAVMLEAAERRARSFAMDDTHAARDLEAPSAFAPAEEAREIGAMASSAEPARRQALTSGEARGAASGATTRRRAETVRQPSARAALAGLDEDVRAERSELLARANDDALSRAHAELDGARSRDELERSQASLVRRLDTAGDGLDANDRRQLRQDLYCRLAETALRLGEARTALEWSRRGIELDGPPSPFLAQLMALEGDALAALGEASSAAASYMRALHVHEALLDESLDGH